MASGPIYKVFVSSTFKDLLQERAEVQKALLKLNCLPVGMELFPAADEETWEFIKKQIDDSDYYVVLVAGRYGSLAKDGVSFTEKEYDYAREKGIPSIGFVHADRSKIPSGQTDSDPEIRKKLDDFVDKVKQRPVREFMNPHQLASEVLSSFVDLKESKPREGFVRTNERVEYRKYAELLEKYTELEKRMRALNASDQPFPTHDTMKTVKLVVPEPNRFQQVGWSDSQKMEWKKLQAVIKEPENTCRTVRFGDVFLLIAQIMLDEAEESVIASTLERKLFPLSNDLNRLRVDFNIDIFAHLKLDLYALNLIDVRNETQIDEPTTFHWTLTEYGRRQFGLLRFQTPTQTPGSQNESS
jgi:hypothetical protein